MSQGKQTGQTYIFGYGSLICPYSRGMTCPELQDRTSIPVVIKGIERTWAKRSVRGMTSMGVRFRSQARCAGIIVPVESQSELEMFDEREVGYHRKLVSLDKVEKVPFLGKHHLNEDHDDFFETLSDCLNVDDDDGCTLSESSESSGDKDDEKDSPSENIQVFVYVPIQPLAPTADHPIVQSYVDTILRGCMAVGGETLCAEFLKTTTGWHPEEWTPSNYDESDDISLVWINDRHSPIYPRGDPTHSRQNAPMFDSLIRKYRSDYFPLRVELNDSSPEETKPSAAKKPPQLQKHRETDYCVIRRGHNTKASRKSDARPSYKKKHGSTAQ